MGARNFVTNLIQGRKVPPHHITGGELKIFKIFKLMFVQDF